ncbi:MAG: sigma-70 family RNA polymerase sigma factor [Ignavibacteriae bacterium]|nr:sigma-70 family RNA polymerase sigma factor [Ignavibacteriota bacterium]
MDVLNASEKQGKFTQLMAPHADSLYNYAIYLTNDRDDAYDLLQETMLKAFRFLEKFEEGTNAKAWLYRIMRNTFINEYRRVKRLPELTSYEEQLSSAELLANEYHDQDELRRKLERDTLDDEMSGAISALPEKFKSVIVLRDIVVLPYEEIAEALEIPIGTVRSRLHRARSLLYERLKTYAKSRGYDVSESFVPTDVALAM